MPLITMVDVSLILDKEATAPAAAWDAREVAAPSPVHLSLGVSGPLG